MPASIRLALAVPLLAAASACFAVTPQWVDPNVSMDRFAANVDGSAIIVHAYNGEPRITRDRGVTYQALSVLGARIERFLASPKDPKVIYATTGNGNSTNPAALYRSDDAGVSWRLGNAAVQVPNPAPALGLLSWFKPGADPDLVFATRVSPSCSPGCSYLPLEAFRSDDGGRTWSSIATPDLVGNFPVLYPSASSAAVVYASTSEGVFRSDDRGGHWRRVRSATTALKLVVDRADPMTVYIHLDEGTGVLASEDGGTTWREGEAGPVPGLFWKLIADPMTAGRAYMLGGNGEIYESRDRARSWFRAAPSSGAFNLLGDDPLRGELDVVINGAGRLFLAKSHAVNSQNPFRALDLPPDDFFVGSDLWWDPREAGAGFTVTQHASGQIFTVWYTFDAQGRATWYSMPGGQWTDPRTLTGTLYAVTGPAFVADKFDATKVKAMAIGTAALRFEDREHAVFTYRFDTGGAQGEKRITRFLFGSRTSDPAPALSDIWWDAAESGWGIAFARQYATVFAVLFAFDENGRATWHTAPGFPVAKVLSDPTAGMGDVYSVTGPPAGGPFDPALVRATKVGTATLRQLYPDNRGLVVFGWTIGEQSTTRLVSPLPF
jgi:hypothetical protein